MHVHDQPPDRRRADLQILQAYIVTQTGFWTTVLIMFAAITPIMANGVWPLIELPKSSVARKTPPMERDVFVTVTRTGELYVDDRKATLAELVRACRIARRPPRDTIYLRIDRNAPFGAVRVVIKAVQSEKIDRVTVLTAPIREMPE